MAKKNVDSKHTSAKMVILTLPLDIADNLEELKKVQFQNEPIDVWDTSEIKARRLPVQLGAGPLISYEGLILITTSIAISKIIGGALDEMGKDFYRLIKSALSKAISSAMSSKKYNSGSGHVELHIPLHGGMMKFRLPLEPLVDSSEENLILAVKRVKWIVFRDSILIIAWPGRKYKITRTYSYNLHGNKWKWFLVSHEHH